MNKSVAIARASNGGAGGAGGGVRARDAGVAVGRRAFDAAGPGGRRRIRRRGTPRNILNIESLGVMLLGFASISF